MTTYYLNGSPLEEGADITINGFTYPYSWLEGTSPSVRASLGIEKTGDINYDEKYYNGVGVPKPLEDREELDDDGNPAYIKVWDEETKMMIDSDARLVSYGLKTTCLRQIKNKTNELLKPTDFYIIRNEVEELQIPESVSTYRSEVIAESTRLQNAIPSVESVEELIELMNSVNFPRVE